MDFGNLVISRKAGESFRIGENITVEIVECRSGRSVVRVMAPKSIPIVRSELLNRDAAKTDQQPAAFDAAESG
jgi:carbon storage regulator CsrA